MALHRRIARPTTWPVDGGALLKQALLIALVASYGLVLFTVVVTVAVLPFGDPQITLVPPDWLLPLYGHVSLLDAFLSILFGPSVGISLLALVLVLLTTPTVYRWLRPSIDELVDGQPDDALALVADVHSHLTAPTGIQTMLPTITAAIGQALKLPYVAITTHDAGELIESAYGQSAAGASLVELPLRYQATPVGELRVTARRSGQSLTPAERKMLHDLAQQVGIALYAAQMTADVQRSRTRLVTAREEERRRIRRDLHDGLGPTLASMAMRLEQARDSLPAGAEESAALLASLTAETQDTIADVRRLVYQLRPPDLDEYGLVSAMREYLQRVTPKGIAITFTAPEAMPGLPAAVEVAAYRIVQEAVNNALRHAQASTIAVTLAQQPATGAPLWLCVEIRDNGQGLENPSVIESMVEFTDGSQFSGIGLRSMRERAEELGGAFALASSAEAGTLVTATLPLDAKESAT